MRGLRKMLLSDWKKLCGVSWQFWLERQHLYELERVTIENQEVLPRIPLGGSPPLS